MYFFRSFLFCLLAVCGARDAFSTVSNRNPNLTIAIVDDQAITLRPSATAQSGMAVRVTDPMGLPIAGLIVDFFNNTQFCPPLLPCNIPPATVYGRFGNGSTTVIVETDANGVARSGSYIGGTSLGSYEVAAWVYSLRSQRNRDFLKGGEMPIAFFTVTQALTLVDGYMSGNWHDPARSGHGLQLEFTDQNSTALAIWFVFGPDGGQNWIYAQGPYDPTKARVTLPAVTKSGARFPPLFNSADVQSASWGSITLTFTDCNSGTLAWNSTLPGYGTGSMPITRLTSIRGTKCPA